MDKLLPVTVRGLQSHAPDSLAKRRFDGGEASVVTVLCWGRAEGPGVCLVEGCCFWYLGHIYE
jgi:hypothetical protein